MRIDDVDRLILAYLLADGRASYRELGEHVGLSPSAAKRRMDRLVTDGVIQRFTVAVDPEVLGWGTEAFVELYCEGAIPPERLAQAVARHPQVTAAYTVTGDADAILHVRAADTRDLERALEAIRAEPFVRASKSVVVLSRLGGAAPPT